MTTPSDTSPELSDTAPVREGWWLGAAVWRRNMAFHRTTDHLVSPIFRATALREATSRPGFVQRQIDRHAALSERYHREPAFDPPFSDTAMPGDGTPPWSASAAPTAPIPPQLISPAAIADRSPTAKSSTSPLVTMPAPASPQAVPVEGNAVRSGGAGLGRPVRMPGPRDDDASGDRAGSDRSGDGATVSAVAAGAPISPAAHRPIAVDRGQATTPSVPPAISHAPGTAIPAPVVHQAVAVVVQNEARRPVVQQQVAATANVVRPLRSTAPRVVRPLVAPRSAPESPLPAGRRSATVSATARAGYVGMEAGRVGPRQAARMPGRGAGAAGAGLTVLPLARMAPPAPRDVPEAMAVAPVGRPLEAYSVEGRPAEARPAEAVSNSREIPARQAAGKAAATPAVDLGQLADAVYERLVLRLAEEWRRRGGGR